MKNALASVIAQKANVFVKMVAIVIVTKNKQNRLKF